MDSVTVGSRWPRISALLPCCHLFGMVMSAAAAAAAALTDPWLLVSRSCRHPSTHTHTQMHFYVLSSVFLPGSCIQMQICLRVSKGFLVIWCRVKRDKVSPQGSERKGGCDIDFPHSFHPFISLSVHFGSISHHLCKKVQEANTGRRYIHHHAIIQQFLQMKQQNT